MLKPQDLLVTLKLATLAPTGEWTYQGLSESLGMSQSEVHAAVRRATVARLLTARAANRAALLEFLEHGVKYAFAIQRGPTTRGMPTGVGAPPLSKAFGRVAESPVWPDAEGASRGYALMPLYKSVPFAARYDASLYELLALTDAIREGGARETKLAVQELRTRLARREHA